jgi:hypothetical protein
MPPIEAFGPAVAIGLILFVMLWFALGTQRNVSRGNALLEWLQGGLPILGRRTTLRWLGSSAIELTIVEPAVPFKEATVVIVLEPRDVGILWAFARARGRRDFVIIRVNLVRPPRFSIDVRDRTGWTGSVTAGAPDGGWREGNWAGAHVDVAGTEAAEAAIRPTWMSLSESTLGVWRLTIQPVVPHLELHVRPLNPDRVDAERLLVPIRDLGQMLAER